MSGDSLIEERSYAFALRVVNAYKYLTTVKGEHVMSKQLLRSGTSVGAMMHEAKFAQSRADFVNKTSPEGGQRDTVLAPPLARQRLHRRHNFCLHIRRRAAGNGDTRVNRKVDQGQFFEIRNKQFLAFM